MSSLPGGVIAVGLLIVGMLLLVMLAIYTLVICVRFRRTLVVLASNTQEKVGFLQARSAALKVHIAQRKSERRLPDLPLRIDLKKEARSWAGSNRGTYSFCCWW